ncbi:MAG: cell division ATP-binding protein FtsE, partial [Actinomycetota bacterium]
MIVFENVSMNYRRSASPALDDVSFEIRDGEFVFLVGQSGAGKSSILRLLMREVTPKVGTVIVDEINVGRLRKRKIPNLRRKFGMVFQDFRLLPEKSV